MADPKKPRAAEEAPAEPAPDAPAGGGKKLLVFGAIGGGAVLIGAAVAGFLLLRRPQPAAPAADAHAAAEAPAEHAPDPHAVPAADDHSLSPEHGEGAASTGHGAAAGDTLPLDVFVVNIKDRDRDRYLKVKAELEVSAPAVADEIEKHLPQVRDAIISLLASKSFEEVRSIEGKNFLREEMLLRVNALLRAGTVSAVYFTEFVVQ